MAVYQADLKRVSAEISKLSNEQLKELCNDTSDDKYDKLLEQVEQIVNLEQERELILVSVRSLAEFNLSKQETFESTRASLLTLVADSNKLKQQIKEKSEQLLKLTNKTSLEETLKAVLVATAEAEEHSENIAQAFLNKEIDSSEFDASYIPKRKLAHSRRYKADRLKTESNERWIGFNTRLFGHLYQ